MLTLELPYPPSVNTYYRHVVIRGRVRVLISKKGRQYREDVALALRGRRIPLLDGRVGVEIDLHPPDRRKRDIDNPQKCLLDSIVKAGVLIDDSQIDRLLVTRGATVKGGRVFVRIRSLENQG